LDQLHHFSSITITLSNLSITLQLFCAKNMKLQLLSHLELITSWNYKFV